MRFYLLLFAGACYLLYAGGQELVVGLQNPSPHTLTLAAFNANPSTAGWFTVSGCQPQWLDAAAQTTKGAAPSAAPEAVFVPLQAVGAKKGAPLTLVLETDSPTSAKLFAAVESMNDSTSRDQVAKKLQPFLPLMVGPKTYTGMIRYGNDDIDSNVRTSLSSGNFNLASNFRVLHEGATPDLPMALLKLLGGFLCAGFLGMRIRGVLGGKGKGGKGAVGTATPVEGPPQSSGPFSSVEKPFDTHI